MAIKKEERCSGGGQWRENVSVNDAMLRSVLCNECRRRIGVRWVQYSGNACGGQYRVLIQHHKAQKHAHAQDAV